MRKALILFLLFYVNIFFCQTEKINFLNFGIVTIKDEFYLGQSLWELEIQTKDSIFLFKEKTSNSSTFICYNLNEKIKNLNSLDEFNIVTIKKSGKTIYKDQIKFEFLPESNLTLLNTDKINNNKIKGKILDCYIVKNATDSFFIIRTNFNNNFNYWYVLKNEKITNIHSEKNEKQPYFTSKIILTDLDMDSEPEFNFFHKTKKKIKMIHLNREEKIIAFLKDGKINLPSITNNYDYSIYKGLFYYNLKKISE